MEKVIVGRVVVRRLFVGSTVVGGCGWLWGVNTVLWTLSPLLKPSHVDHDHQ